MSYYAGDSRTIYVPAYLGSAVPDTTRRRYGDLYCTSIHGTLYYTPGNVPDETSYAASPATLPVPHIGPRSRRPHTIHIVSYPPGYIPNELRPRTARPPDDLDLQWEAAQRRRREKKAKKEQKKKRAQEKKQQAVVSEKPVARIIEKILGLLHARSSAKPPTRSASTRTSERRSIPSRGKSRPVSLFSLGSLLSRVPETIYEEPMDQPPPAMDGEGLMMQRGPLLSARIQSNSANRNSILSTRSMKTIMSSSVSEVAEKPVASGSGLSCSILLAEPNVFLTGFDHDGRSRHHSTHSTALLRGRLQLKVTKTAKIKSVTLKLTGTARTEWPEGIPPAKIETFEEESLRTQALTFFHAMHNSWETPYGNQCTYTLKRAPENDASPTASMLSLPRGGGGGGHGLSAKELKRLSLQSVQARSFGKGESPILDPVQVKGYKQFHPGTYEYSFELPIDHHQLETTKLPYGSVKWELETTVERTGAFKPNLHGAKDVSIVRVPDQLSLEMSEPISISRKWEDQLHYDIVISGKSFPIGTKIPIAFKLTPLAKVQVHRLKVFVTESIEYWTNDRRVTRKDSGRKVLLLEKTAGKPLDKQYECSEIRILGGGELSPEERHEARDAASRRRTAEAQRSSTAAEPLPEPSENLLGDLDLGLETYWGSTEMELNVQIPTCEQMIKDKALRLNPDCSWKNVNVFHWIKIVMRISRLDPDDPAKKRRRHFEISIDSPFTVLNCRATQANMSLPQYSGLDVTGFRQQSSCGCPDAEVLATNPSPASSTGTLPLGDPDPTTPTGLPAPPQAAHLHAINRSSGAPRPHSIAVPPSANPLQRVRDHDHFQSPRPIHLLRVPSYDPPAFNADVPPPRADDTVTPPPNYDAIVGTPSVDGLADYFARLADYDDQPHDGADGADDAAAHHDDSDSGDENVPTRISSRTGRVHVANPRTPGGRLVPSRSLDIERPIMNLSMAAVTRRDV